MSAPVSEAVQTVEQLVAAREARGLSVADVSQQLKLSPRQVQAIEQADWEALPGPAFTRAVLRGYGRLLGVDVDALVAGIAGATAATELRPTSSLDAPIRAGGVFGFGSGGSGNSLAWVGLVVLGLVALALFFGGEGGVSNLRSWIGGTADDSAQRRTADGADQASRAGAGGASTGSGTETTELALKGGSAPAGTASGDSGAVGKQGGGAADARAGAATPGGADAAASASAASATAKQAGASETAAAPGTAPGVSQGAPPGTAQGSAAGTAAGAVPGSQATAPAPDAARTEPSGSGERTVSLRFARESWIEIRGADGSVLVTGTQQPGTSRSLRFNGSVSLVIGNAEHVKVELDAKPFDIGPRSQAGVARFSLP